MSVEIVDVDGADAYLRVIFNTTEANPLADVSAAAAAKWTARYDGVGYQGLSVTNDVFDTLVLHLQATGASAGLDVLNYSNAPSDIADALGRQLAAFAGFRL